MRWRFLCARSWFDRLTTNGIWFVRHDYESKIIASLQAGQVFLIQCDKQIHELFHTIRTKYDATLFMALHMIMEMLGKSRFSHSRESCLQVGEGREVFRDLIDVVLMQAGSHHPLGAALFGNATDQETSTATPAILMSRPWNRGFLWEPQRAFAARRPLLQNLRQPACSGGYSLGVSETQRHVEMAAPVAAAFRAGGAGLGDLGDIGAEVEILEHVVAQTQTG